MRPQGRKERMEKKGGNRLLDNIGVGWNGHAETCFSSAKLATRFLVGGRRRGPRRRRPRRVSVDVDVAVRVERSGATCPPKNYYLPLISWVLRLICVVRYSGVGSKRRQIKPAANC